MVGTQRAALKEGKFRAVCALDGNNQNFQTRHVSNSQQTAEVNNFD